MIYGSDLSKKYAYPLNYAMARQIPGTTKLACIGSAHHNTGAGPLCIVDLATGPNVAEGMRRITPVRFVETPDRQPHNGWYDCPFPLSENYFLVSYTFSQRETDTRGYAIYLLDVYGGKELIYRDPELSALFPVPIRERHRPGVVGEAAEGDCPEAEFLVQDVHEGLPASDHGKARYVQIVECHERHIHTRPYNIQVGPDSGFETKTVLGTAPVERDGSAYFRVPAGKSVFFSVLDADRKALHTMRSVTNAQAGERTSCVGCHEPARQTPPNRVPFAAMREASAIEPPPWGVRALDYRALVQPILDKHCVRCHDGSGAKGKAYDLRAQKKRPFMGMAVPASYFNLRRHVQHAPIHQYYLAPGTFGAHVSPLTKVLQKGHNEIELNRDDRQLMYAWMDCNAPFLGWYQDIDLTPPEPQTLDPAPYGRAQIEGRRAEILKRAPAGHRLACYLDCGLAIKDAAKGGPGLRLVRGWPYVWGDSGQAAPGHFGTIVFEDEEVALEATGLDPKGQYQLAFTWWDFDAGGRTQSVHVSGGEPRKSVTLVRKTPLPGYRGAKLSPQERCLLIPPEVYLNGKVRIAFRRENRANAVVSEVWLWEATSQEGKTK